MSRQTDFSSFHPGLSTIRKVAWIKVGSPLEPLQLLDWQINPLLSFESCRDNSCLSRLIVAGQSKIVAVKAVSPIKLGVSFCNRSQKPIFYCF